MVRYFFLYWIWFSSCNLASCCFLLIESYKVKKKEISVVLFCDIELEQCTGRKLNDRNLKLFIRQNLPHYCMALRHTYQTKGLPQRTHNSFALDRRALLYFIASFVSIYCFVWWPFFHCIVNNLALLNRYINRAFLSPFRPLCQAGLIQLSALFFWAWLQCAPLRLSTAQLQSLWSMVGPCLWALWASWAAPFGWFMSKTQPRVHF